jgi:hypothetical protein
VENFIFLAFFVDAKGTMLLSMDLGTMLLSMDLGNPCYLTNLCNIIKYLQTQKKEG